MALSNLWPGWRRTRRFNTRQSGAERGLLTTELALIFPIALGAVLGVVQASLWAHANAVAQTAAEQGAEAAALFRPSGSQADARSQGVEAAEAFVAEAGGINDYGAAVLFNLDGSIVTVVVAGDYPGLFGSLKVEASSSQVVERITGG